MHELAENGIFAANIRGNSHTHLAKKRGRTYHTYNDGKYSMPNDERENNRLDLQHNLFIRTFDDRLGTAPPNDTGTKVGRVLDIGTGSGIWAIDFGDEHPESEVIGVDLSVVQAGFLPPNVTFEVDDIEEPWAFSNGFDYIHSRMMTGSISDWDQYLQKCYDNLNPGGYLELNDIDAVPLSDDGTLTEDTNLMKSVRLWHEGLAGLGRHFQEFSRFKDALAKVGFEDVHIKRYRWPTNGWPKDKKHKELGIWNLENIAPHWDGFIMAPLTRALGWTKEDVLALGKDARRDFADRSIHAYFNM
ncbi:Secondary metabolism regulator LAE1 [Colletotrichum sp. SAR 10_70]|nr:Secondary metabolism regulator LAE1 [Colletotrichum sp. SAR 10_71]KAI8188858.1 Secondary metabolism regulator LAE1 [Colletotrichum sp. SAR 10_70]KAI8232099.1 Secondary metabolism regulator LAE1 [Colletotrichum sp. SAR 10_86]